MCGLSTQNIIWKFHIIIALRFFLTNLKILWRRKLYSIYTIYYILWRWKLYTQLWVEKTQLLVSWAQGHRKSHIQDPGLMGNKLITALTPDLRWLPSRNKKVILRIEFKQVEPVMIVIRKSKNGCNTESCFSTKLSIKLMKVTWFEKIDKHRSDTRSRSMLDRQA